MNEDPDRAGDAGSKRAAPARRSHAAGRGAFAALALLCACGGGRSQLGDEFRTCYRDVPSDVAVRMLPREAVEARLDALVPENADRARRIEELLRDAGCDERVVRAPVRQDDEPNVVCEIDSPGSSVIVIGAHYDRTGGGEGAADNWSGTALLASLYATFVPQPLLEHDLRFIAFAEEEDGLVGSKRYVGDLPEDERKRIVAMVNLDTLGLGPTHAEPAVSDPTLVCWLSVVALSTRSPLRYVNADRVGTSDHRPFRRAGIPVVSVHSIGQDTLDIIHSPQDTLDRIDRDAYYDTYRLLTLYVVLLDRVLARPAPPREGAPEARAPEARAPVRPRGGA